MDKWLKTVLDEPRMDNCVVRIAAERNSNVNQARGEVSGTH